MELPIAPQTYQPSPDALVRAIKRADLILARMVAEETALEGATAMTNPRRPGVHMANFAADLRVPEGSTADAVLDEIADHFQSRNLACHYMQCNETHWPDDLAQSLSRRGYQRGPTASVCLLHDYTPPKRDMPAMQVIPGRAAYAQLQEFYVQSARDHHGADDALAAQIAQSQIDHLDEPRFDMFVGRIDGRIAGIAGVITLGNIGVIDNVYTAPQFRGRGVASALMHHTIEHCSRALFEQVILEVLADSRALPLYESLGFKPVASYHKFVRP